MRRWRPHRPLDDPPKDPEIQRWFQALGPPPVEQALPNLHANVRARIAQQRARRGIFAWAPTAPTPAWVAAMAVVLVVSLGLNVWWGLLTLGPPADPMPAGLGSVESLRTYRFQVGMARAIDVGTLLAARPARWDPTPVVGFTPQAARSITVRLGGLSADTLAALQGGAREAADQHLGVLIQVLTSVQAPRALPQYLRAMQPLVQNPQYERELVTRFLALFEPLYEDAYAHPDTGEQVTLFRAGAWLETLALAAAVGDRAAVHHGAELVGEIHRGLAQLHAPPEMLDALERLRSLAARQVLTDQDVRAIRTLVQDLQGMLSA
jgi:hypothetical protein